MCNRAKVFQRAKWLLALLVFSGIGVVQAQQMKETKKEAGLSFVWAEAMGDFGDNVDRPMPGVIFSFGGLAPNIPLVLSTELGLLSYGFDDHLELLFPSATNTPSTSVVNIDAKNSILMAHLVGRFEPIQGKIRPYIDGLAGVKYFTSNIDVESEALHNDTDSDIIIIDDNQIRTSSNYDAFTMSYGLGAGVNIQFYNGGMGYQNAPVVLSLHLGVRYLFGTEADYLTENSISTDGDRIRFEQVESDTDILIPNVGLQIGF